MNRIFRLGVVGVLVLAGCSTGAPAATPILVYVTPQPTATPTDTPMPTDTPVPTDTPAPAISADCVAAMGPLVTSLEDLDSRLSVGLTYAEYSKAVADLRVFYDRIKIATLDLDCLTLVGSPAETAMNDYITAYNTWNKCVASVSCTNKSIQTKLQAQWSKATDLIAPLRASMP